MSHIKEEEESMSEMQSEHRINYVEQSERIRQRKLDFIKSSGYISHYYHKDLLKAIPIGGPSTISISSKPQGEELTFVSYFIVLDQKIKSLKNVEEAKNPKDGGDNKKQQFLNKLQGISLEEEKERNEGIDQVLFDASATNGAPKKSSKGNNSSTQLKEMEASISKNMFGSESMAGTKIKNFDATDNSSSQKKDNELIKPQI